MSKLVYLIVILVSFQLLAAPGAHGPNGEHLNQDKNNTESTLGRQPDGSVVMPMEMQAALQIYTTLAQADQVASTTLLHGVVKPHNEGHAIVQPSNNGHYYAPEGGTPLSGTTVKKGDILGYIQYSDTAFELASQNSELLSVRNDIAQAQRDVKRLKDLGELASQQELERLETQLKTLSEQEVALQKRHRKTHTANRI